MIRENIYLARYCDAFATVSTGTAYIVALNYNGDAEANKGGERGAFQLPKAPDTPQVYRPNLWRLYELPTLQRQVGVLIRLSGLSQLFPQGT